MINRVGDCFFIRSIGYIVLTYPVLTFYNSSINLILSFLLVCTFVTKRAIFPFSAWLPLAIAAPTPISALVHSSTLVTAGLYLCIRFSYLLYRNYILMVFFLIISVFTSFYAGLNSVFEKDMKKLIALSTLSHLGFIGIAFSCGLLSLSFFHLLVHAFFKSLLFIAIGDVITNIFHSQDIRFLSRGFYLTPASFFTMLVRILNLLGIPSVRGFFSKDLVLETCNFCGVSYILLFIIFANVVFTYYYTYQLVYFSFHSLKRSPFIQHLSPIFTHRLLLFFSINFESYFWVSLVELFGCKSFTCNYSSFI